MTKIQNTDNTERWEDVEQQELSLVAGGNASGPAIMEDSLVFF